mmetsp:Transcript_57241/g.170691  ORF Transcript_57241/g.170691 Transcript_57241/m.170691 type:complete len:188 (+) Transcript_57241:697-1260(+)
MPILWQDQFPSHKRSSHFYLETHLFRSLTGVSHKMCLNFTPHQVEYWAIKTVVSNQTRAALPWKRKCMMFSPPEQPSAKRRASTLLLGHKNHQHFQVSALLAPFMRMGRGVGGHPQKPIFPTSDAYETPLQVMHGGLFWIHQAPPFFLSESHASSSAFLLLLLPSSFTNRWIAALERNILSDLGENQ